MFTSASNPNQTFGFQAGNQVTFTFDDTNPLIGLYGFQSTSRLLGLGMLQLNKNRCTFNNNLIVEDFTTCLTKSSNAAGFESGT